MSISLLVIAALVVSLAIMLSIWLPERRRMRQENAHIQDELNALKTRLHPITSLDDELTKLSITIDEASNKLDNLKLEYSNKREILLKLEEQVAIFDEKLSFAELGIYEPHFDFTDSEQFKTSILRIRQVQKDLISSKLATVCNTEWTLEGSKSKGQTMINRQTRLTLRAFNAECDAAISNARWNNVVAMEKRILAAFDQINKENSSMNLSISSDYFNSKLEELRLTHEYRERQKQEREDRVELARAEREEKRLVAQAEAAEKQEQKFKDLVEKARKEAELATGKAKSEMASRIAELERALAEAHAESERARAMAEMTKSGYVYIISNVGSFGADVVKIGLTRRLDPDDRVRELGDASVPFSFDTHAMIYSDDAPSLESALHKEFAQRRVNMSNFRKEFFTVSLDEVEDAVARLAPDASFFKDREAQEWHETLARRKQSLEDIKLPSESFPITL